MGFSNGYDSGYADAIDDVRAGKVAGLGPASGSADGGASTQPAVGSVSDLLDVGLKLTWAHPTNAIAVQTGLPLSYGVGSTMFRFADSLGDVDLNALSWENVTDASTLRNLYVDGDVIQIVALSNGQMPDPSTPSVFGHIDGAWGTKTHKTTAVVPQGSVCTYHCRNAGTTVSLPAS